MTEQLFSSATPEERRQMVMDNSYITEETKLKRFYSNDELVEIKDSLTKDVLKIADVDQQIKELTAPLKEEKKVVSEILKDKLSQVRKGYEEYDATIYGYDDQETGFMHYYDQDGAHLHSRKLYPSERQTSILSINQKQQQQ